jgi:hypothetical protein
VQRLDVVAHRFDHGGQRDGKNGAPDAQTHDQNSRLINMGWCSSARPGR